MMTILHKYKVTVLKIHNTVMTTLNMHSNMTVLRMHNIVIV